MELSQNKIFQAFDVYARLAARGELQKQEVTVLWEDDEVRHLVENFARHVQCIIIDDAENYYLIPLSMESPFHISNETFKRKYMPAKAINMDMYLLYLAVIVLFGCFYDNYQTSDPAEFVTMAWWLEQMDYCIDSLKHQDDEVLRQKEKEFNYNWLALVRKWTDMDSLKETVRPAADQCRRRADTGAAATAGKDRRSTVPRFPSSGSPAAAERMAASGPSYRRRDKRL
ncbi:DUF6063 family protein [uncultured Megasphaera sp.]|jgi:hypothetical protein|uniref:DUF6063 family protein n=1 Tax=uncultured Megasphaera sp. TaxID=165188 RepID=UPI0025EE3074|nr:DUF6063 family protein [uncultured Megasphaera sp.]